MEKRVQISQSLYLMMVNYIMDHYDPNDRERFIHIRDGIERKRQADIRHNLYSAYKTETDPETREILRASYLDTAGVPSHGRWDEEAEASFREGNFAF